MFWTDIKGGLRTKDKLMNWGVLSSPISSVRHQEIDTLSHLFFSCPYSREGWKQVCDLCGISKANQSWDAKINWLIRKFSWKSVHSIVRKIAWEAIIAFGLGGIAGFSKESKGILQQLFIGSGLLLGLKGPK